MGNPSEAFFGIQAAGGGRSVRGAEEPVGSGPGLLANAEGCPAAVEVFEGNTGDPKTVAAQVAKLRKRFKLERIILVGDRGLPTNARIREDLQPEGIDWITALRTPQIQALVTAGALQLSLFDERDLAEIAHPDYPGSSGIKHIDAPMCIELFPRNHHGCTQHMWEARMNVAHMSPS